MIKMSNELAVFGPYKATTCEWSIGPGLGGYVDGKTVCCGKDVVQHRPYCAEHLNQAYYQPMPFEEMEALIDKDLMWMVPSDIDLIEVIDGDI